MPKINFGKSGDYHRKAGDLTKKQEITDEQQFFSL